MVRVDRHWAPKRFHEKLAGPMLLAIGIFYLTFHVLSGERGIYALLKEERRLELLKTELADVQAKRKMLEHRVRLLSDSSLDLDLLDERTRLLLNEAGKDEMVIPLEARDEGRGAK